MELNVTSLFTHKDYRPYYVSNSIANLGENAAEITWNESMRLAESVSLIHDDETHKNLIDCIYEGGDWPREDMESWTRQELNALVFQFITGDMNEAMYQAGIDWQDMTFDQLMEAWPSDREIRKIWERSNFPFFILTNDDGEKQIWHDGFSN